MKNYFYIFLFLTVLFTSCRNDFDFEPSTGNLAFSRETVYLDTVFTNIGSSTYTLKVYNKSNKNIAIPKIQLGKGEASKYRLMVDGIPGKVFENVEMLAKDSLFIFIEVTADVADANPADFLYTDQIKFGTENTFQKIELVTLIQDAYFIFPERVQNPNNTYTYEEVSLGMDTNGNAVTIRASVLNETDPLNGDELHWKNDKPYVIYGYAVVPNTKTLVVDAGARIHFHAASGLIVSNEASLQINGTTSTTEALENEVIFEGDRLEPDFSETPGQWGTIWFTKGSTNNTINNLTIKNALVGMYVTGNDDTINPTLALNNVQIYNCSNVGILAVTGNIVGSNIVVNNCGEASLGATFGGSYEFTHCTFANYWNNPNQTCVVINDYIEVSNAKIVEELVKADFKNCIIYGSSNLGLNLDKAGTTFDYNFTNCLIKFIDSNNQFGTNALYQFSANPYINCIIARNTTSNLPNFKNPLKNQFEIQENSIAINNGTNLTPNFNDILDNPRPTPPNTNPDIGAYQFK